MKIYSIHQILTIANTTLGQLKNKKKLYDTLSSQQIKSQCNMTCPFRKKIKKGDYNRFCSIYDWEKALIWDNKKYGYICMVQYIPKETIKNIQ